MARPVFFHLQSTASILARRAWALKALCWALVAGCLVGPSVLAADPDPETAQIHAVICGAPAPGAADQPAHEILAGYGTGGFTVDAMPAAQAYFTNGMQLAHAFAHKAAIAAFQEAEVLDPACAMCVWGEAWARGPTINYGVKADEQARLAALADKAASLLRPDAPERDRRLISALRKRYHGGGGGGPGDYAFAREMDALARLYPADNEIAVITADAWMIPAAQKANRANLPRAIELLKAALQRRPDDTGAIHFYIHATEMNGVAGDALPYARRLEALAPAASHLAHMPSHTYYLTGFYADAVRSNLDAVGLDDANARHLALRDGAWGLNYHAHNLHFGIAAAMVDGDGEAALSLSDDLIARAPGLKPGSPYGGRLVTMGYAAEGRYAATAKVLALPEPRGAAVKFRPMWRYARGEALAREGRAAGVKAEAAGIADDPSTSAGPVSQVARLVLVGRAAMLDGKPLEAAKSYRRAAEIQEARFPRTDDPATWWYPVRRSLAAALLDAGQPRQAMAEADSVLKLWPDDPLTRLVQARASEKLGDDRAAAGYMVQARKGWAGDPTEVRAALL